MLLIICVRMLTYYYVCLRMVTCACMHGIAHAQFCSRPRVVVIGASLSEPHSGVECRRKSLFYHYYYYYYYYYYYRWYVRFGPRGRFRLGHSPKHKTSMPQAESLRQCRRTRLHAVRLPATHTPKQRRLTNTVQTSKQRCLN